MDPAAPGTKQGSALPATATVGQREATSRPTYLGVSVVMVEGLVAMIIKKPVRASSQCLYTYQPAHAVAVTNTWTVTLSDWDTLLLLLFSSLIGIFFTDGWSWCFT